VGDQCFLAPGEILSMFLLEAIQKAPNFSRLRENKGAKNSTFWDLQLSHLTLTPTPTLVTLSRTV
jgi:hypothetical protein